MRPSQDCGAMPRHEIGFARVSRDEQNLSLPLQAQGDGSGRLFQDTAVGVKTNRKGLADALDAYTPVVC